MKPTKKGSRQMPRINKDETRTGLSGTKEGNQESNESHESGKAGTAAGTRQHTLNDPAAGSAKIADKIRRLK